MRYVMSCIYEQALVMNPETRPIIIQFGRHDDATDRLVLARGKVNYKYIATWAVGPQTRRIECRSRQAIQSFV